MSNRETHEPIEEPTHGTDDQSQRHCDVDVRRVVAGGSRIQQDKENDRTNEPREKQLSDFTAKGFADEGQN